MQIKCNWVNSVRQVFSKHQQRYNSKGKHKTVITVDVPDEYSGRGKGYFLKVFCISNLVVTWSFVKRANHCWHSSTEKSLNFAHFRTRYSSTKVQALKIILLCNSVKKIHFFSCSFCCCCWWWLFFLNRAQNLSSEYGYRHELR